MRYENPLDKGWTKTDIEGVIERDDPDELLYVPIVVSLSPPDCGWAESICLKLAAHPHWNVRGNAILGFGHLSRTCGKLDEDSIKPVVIDALQDPNEYVRNHARTALDDITDFLGWRF
jgi:hypothetical protein